MTGYVNLDLTRSWHMGVEHGWGLFALGMILTVFVFWWALTYGAKIMDNSEKKKEKNKVNPYAD